jgi:hypothetical protein
MQRLIVWSLILLWLALAWYLMWVGLYHSLNPFFQALDRLP